MLPQARWCIVQLIQHAEAAPGDLLQYAGSATQDFVDRQKLSDVRGVRLWVSVGDCQPTTFLSVVAPEVRTVDRTQSRYVKLW